MRVSCSYFIGLAITVVSAYHTSRRGQTECIPETTMRRPYDHDCFITHHQPIVLFAVGFTFIHTLPAFHLSYILGQAHAESNLLVVARSCVSLFIPPTTFLYSVSRLIPILYLQCSFSPIPQCVPLVRMPRHPSSSCPPFNRCALIPMSFPAPTS